MIIGNAKRVISCLTGTSVAVLGLAVAAPASADAGPEQPVLTKVTMFTPVHPKARNFTYGGAHALDQNGQPIADLTLMFTTAGVDNETHTVRTDSSGVAIYRFAVEHVGDQKVTAAGPDGAPSASASTTVVPFPISCSLTATSDAKGEVVLKATNKPSDSRVEGVMAFYQYVPGSNGRYVYRSQARLSHLPGYAYYTFTGLKSGSKLGFRTRLGGSADYDSPLSPGATVTVK